MTVQVVLPGVLADLAGGCRHLEIELTGSTVADLLDTLAGLLDALASTHPVLERRIRDEAGTLRRFVNVYVDGEDVRRLHDLATPVGPHAEVFVIQSVAGG